MAVDNTQSIICPTTGEIREMSDSPPPPPKETHSPKNGYGGFSERMRQSTNFSMGQGQTE